MLSLLLIKPKPKRNADSPNERGRFVHPPTPSSLDPRKIVSMRSGMRTVPARY